MQKGESGIEHYKGQRDLLGYFLLEVVGVSKERIGQILGIGRAAVSLQFKTRRKKTK